MAAIIQFYVPTNFRPKSPCSSTERGKVIEFCSYVNSEIVESATSVNPLTLQSAVAQNGGCGWLFAED